MAPICGYLGKDAKAKAVKMLLASKYQGNRKIWENQGMAIAQISPEIESPGFALDGSFYEGDIDINTNINIIKSLDNFKDSLQRVNGDYALATIKEGKLLIARDPVGVKPLYYGFDTTEFAFASEKAMLRALAIKDIKTLTPGSILIYDEEIEIIEERIFEQATLIQDEKQAFELLKKALNRAIEIRLRKLKNAGILFSGGIDSSLLAFKIPSAKLYVTGIAGSHDLEQARLSARALGMEDKLRVVEIKLDEIEAQIPEVINIIENSSPMQVELGLALSFAMQAMKKEGILVAVSGQGSDELFAGYRRYTDILNKQGEAALQSELFKNIKNIARENLERDVAIANANSLELIMPFLDKDLINLVLSFDPKLKIKVCENGKGGIAKYILRKVAEEFIPREIAWRDKKSMQYGSGMHVALKTIARKNGFSGKMGVERYLACIEEGVKKW
ncbi:MAG: asparagine synthase-related protein [Methanocellales archaeon]